MLVDNVAIHLKAGDGGSGLVSFCKEKFKPFGGPDGGDGGRGGDVYLSADSDVKDLSSYRHRRYYSAQNGRSGGSNKMHGADGKDLLIKVPLGTKVYKVDSSAEELVGDLWQEGQTIRAAEGGKGGRGNVRFATATNKAPKTAQKGIEGERADIVLRVRLPVDVAIIGLPNSGKSQLLSALSGANPSVADYPFTTQEPVLGSVDADMKRYIWVELPGIVYQSHIGRGLGNGHLSQAERARVLVYIIDIKGNNPVDDMKTLLGEIKIFDKGLAEKKGVLALNKADLLTDQSELDRIFGEMQVFGCPVFMVSAKEKSGLNEFVKEVHNLVAEASRSAATGLPPTVIFRPRPVDGRSGR